jgi:hypothetical protein
LDAATLRQMTRPSPIAPGWSARAPVEYSPQRPLRPQRYERVSHSEALRVLCVLCGKDEATDALGPLQQREPDGAGLYWALSPCAATIVQMPLLSNCKVVAVLRVQTAGVLLRLC